MRVDWRWPASLWALPVAVPIWALYVLPFWALGWHERDTPSGSRFVARFRVTKRSPAWLLRRWEGWAGHAMPFAVVTAPGGATARTMTHERRHTDQWLVLGPLFVVVYLARSATVGYRDNELEEDARRAEGRDA